jgi:hypothetical protein
MDTFNKIAVAETYVNSARIIAAFLLHFDTIPEINVALNMTQYCKANYDKYRNWNASFAFMISVMKLIGGVFCDAINMYVICMDDNIGDVIGDYVAFGIIACIDDVIFGLVNSSVNAGDILEAAEEELLIDLSESKETDKETDERMKEKYKKGYIGVCALIEKFFMGIYFAVFKMLYVVIFYYLGPFIVFVMVNSSADIQHGEANRVDNV